MTIKQQSFTQSIEAYLKTNESWLTDDDLPVITALRAMARELDKELTSTMLSQYGLHFRALDKKRPTAVEDDELEILLRGNG